MMPRRRWGSAKLVACLACVAKAVPAFAQTLGQGDEVGISLWRVLASLLIIVIFGVGALLVVRMRTGQLKLWEPAASRRLQIVEVSRVVPQSALCLVRLDGSEYLIAITAGSVALIEKRVAPLVESQE
jgi:flagellar biogenesis protein FliO